ncbi:MAG: hypothetical protein JKY03_08650 [Aureispira sp.]|nr:hypothetical protein [Aureispira sp.]
MWLHRLFICVLIIMVFFVLNLDWFYHSYNNNLINPFFVDNPISKPFWGDLFLYESYASYALLGLFIILTPKRLFLTTVVLRILMFIIGIQITLSILIIILQSNGLTISSINTGFILFLMINLALIKRFISFWSVAVANKKQLNERNRSIDETILD